MKCCTLHKESTSQSFSHGTPKSFPPKFSSCSQSLALASPILDGFCDRNPTFIGGGGLTDYDVKTDNDSGADFLLHSEIYVGIIARNTDTD